MAQYIVAYIAAAICFLGIDFVWLSTMAKPFYRERLGPLLLDEFNMTAAGLFYLIYVGGIVVLAIAPALATGSWRTALINGAVLGLVAYGTYDMTNLAVLRGWPAIVSAVDMAWGTVLTATTALAGYTAARWIG